MIPAPRPRNVLPLALPAVAGTLFEPILGVIDVVMLGSFGPATLAAVGACAFVFMSLMNLCLGIGVGTQALAARAIGAGNPGEARAIATRSLRVNLVVGIALMALILACAPLLAAAVCADEESARLGTQYLRFRALGIPFGALVASWRGIHLANRNALRVLVVMGIAACVHVLLNLVLIPRAAAFQIDALGAAAISSAVASVVAGTLFTGGGFPFPSTPAVIPAATILKASIAPALQGLLTALGYAAFVGALGVGGTAVQGTATVLINLAAFAYLAALGMGTAANTLVGQHLGARDVPGARAAISVVIQLALLISGPLLLFCFFTPGLAVSLLKVTPSVAALAVVALPILTVGVAADQFGVPLMMSMVAAGRAPLVAAAQVGMHWLVLVPGAWWLANNGMAIPGSMILFAAYRIGVAVFMAGLALRTLQP